MRHRRPISSAPDPGLVLLPPNKAHGFECLLPSVIKLSSSLSTLILFCALVPAISLTTCHVKPCSRLRLISISSTYGPQYELNMNSIPPESLPAPANGHENQGTLINAFAWWTTVVAFTFVAFRLYTTLAIVKARLWFDDWHILAAMVLCQCSRFDGGLHSHNSLLDGFFHQRCIDVGRGLPGLRPARALSFS